MEGDGKTRAAPPCQDNKTNNPKNHLDERAGGEEKEVEGNKTRSSMLTAATHPGALKRVR
jgi:hypothetical protein